MYCEGKLTEECFYNTQTKNIERKIYNNYEKSSKSPLFFLYKWPLSESKKMFYHAQNFQKCLQENAQKKANTNL